MPITKERARERSARMHAAMTPEQRTARARKAHLASAVNAVVNRAPELTPEQTERLRAIFGSAPR